MQAIITAIHNSGLKKRFARIFLDCKVSSILNCEFIIQVHSHQYFFLLILGYYMKIWIFITDSLYSRSKPVNLNGLQRVLQEACKFFWKNFLQEIGISIFIWLDAAYSTYFV